MKIDFHCDPSSGVYKDQPASDRGNPIDAGGPRLCVECSAPMKFAGNFTVPNGGSHDVTMLCGHLLRIGNPTGVIADMTFDQPSTCACPC